MKRLKLATFTILIANLAFSQGILPMVMVKDTQNWRVFDTEGNQMWQILEGQFTAPRGYVNGFFGGFSMNKTENSHNGVLISPQGSVSFAPNFGFPVAILTAPDEYGLMLLAKIEDGDRFIGDLQSNIRSKIATNLNYLGNRLVAIAEKPDPNTDFVQTVVSDVLTNQIVTILPNIIAADQYADGLFRIQNEYGKVGFARLDGSILIPPQYEEEFLTDPRNVEADFNQFVNGVAFLLGDETVDCYNKFGNLLWQAPRSNVVWIGRQHVKIMDENGTWSVTGENGQILNASLPFDAVSNVNERGIFWYQTGEEQGIMDIRGQKRYRTTSFDDGRISATHVFIKTEDNKYVVFNEFGVETAKIAAKELIDNKFGKIVAESSHGTYDVFSADGQLLVANLTHVPQLGKGYFVHTYSSGKVEQYDFYNDLGKKVLQNSSLNIAGTRQILIENLSEFFPY